MLERVYQQERDDDMGTSGTKTYDLDFNSPITQLLIKIEAQNHNTGNQDNPIEANVSKIEVVDGGEVLWSLPGDVMIGYVSPVTGIMPSCSRTSAGSDTPYQTFPINFGRYLFDKQFAFNPNAHKNPQLRVTFDEATIRAAGASGFISDTFQLTLLVRLMEGMESPPSAFLSCRDISQYTSLGSGDEPTDLPTDRVLRSIFTRIYESGTSLATNVTKFKLSANGGEFVPFELYTAELVDLMVAKFPEILVDHYGGNAAEQTHQTWVYSVKSSNVRGHNARQVLTAASPTASQMEIHSRLDDGSNWAAARHFNVSGHGVHNTLIYPFGNMNDPADWYDPRNLRKLELFLTQGDAGAEINVCVENVYQY